MSRLAFRPYCLLYLSLLGLLLVACDGTSQGSPAAVVSTATTPASAVNLPSATPPPSATAAPPTVTSTSVATVIATAASVTATDEGIDSGLEHGLLTVATPGTSAPAPLPCSPDNERWRIDVEQRLPPDVPLSSARLAFDAPQSLYMAIGNWVGSIEMRQPLTLDDPYNIFPLRVVEIQELSAIMDIEVQSESAFLVGDSQLVVAHTDFYCYLLPITIVDFPFAVQDLELEGDRIYVSGVADGRLHIEILERDWQMNIERLGTLTFDPAEWSVVEEEILTLDHDDLTLSVTDVSVPESPVSRAISLALDPQWRIMSMPQLVDDSLSLVVWERGLLSVTGLLAPEPELTWRELDSYYILDSHQAVDNTLFVGGNFCDMGNCLSLVFMTTRDPEAPLVEINLYPHHPVYTFYPIREDVVFAFSDYSLIVIDLTAPEGQEIVRTYPLR